MHLPLYRLSKNSNQYILLFDLIIKIPPFLALFSFSEIVAAAIVVSTPRFGE